MRKCKKELRPKKKSFKFLTRLTRPAVILILELCTLLLRLAGGLLRVKHHHRIAKTVIIAGCGMAIGPQPWWHLFNWLCSSKVIPVEELPGQSFSGTQILGVLLVFGALLYHYFSDRNNRNKP